MGQPKTTARPRVPPSARGSADMRRALLATVIAGIALLGISVVVFGYLMDSVLEGDGIAAVDPPLSAWLAAHREPGLTSAMRVLTRCADPIELTAASAGLCAVIAWHKRTPLPMALGGAALGGFGLSVLAVKALVGRPRPAMQVHAVGVDGYSFPSGHATGIAVVTVTSVWMIGHWFVRSGPVRLAVLIPACALILGVGFSRVYLGVHYASDVLAGWALGTAWATVLIAATRVWEARRGSRIERPKCPFPGAFGHCGSTYVASNPEDSEPEH